MDHRRGETDAREDARKSGEDERALAVIWPLLGRHIAFHRRLVDLTGNVKAALMLSQTIYWTRHGRDIGRNAGWFFKTSEQWEMETGLSAREQSTARELLRGLSVLHEQRTGIPARLHFRLAADELAGMLSERIGRAAARFECADAAALAELLGPSLAYHRVLAGTGGGVHAGLMLSRAIYLTRLRWRRREEPWICNSVARWTEEIGLTRREQETARRDLARAGVWEEALAGIPPRLLARVRLECLLALLTDRPSTPHRASAAQCDPDCGLATGRLSQIGESSMGESRILVSPKPPDQIRRIRHHSTAESAAPHIQGSTGDPVQPPDARDALDCQAATPGGGELIFPEGLLPEERTAARLLVERCGAQAQALLDELSGRLQAQSVRTSPVAYLRGLVNRAKAGTFVPELGPRVAAARLRRQEEIALRRQRESDERRLAAERATPEYQARVAARREEIRRILDGMKRGRQS